MAKVTEMHSRCSLERLVAALFCLVFFSAFLSCSKTDKHPNSSAIERAGGKTLLKTEIEKMAKVAGQKIYVPVYAHIYHGGDMIFDLTTTLSIRNTDGEYPIYITSARYYDTPGKLLREYLDSPVLLPPMATLDYVVGERERAGGSGANFVVEWFSDNQISMPIVESVMIGTSGQQGISFISMGKEIK